MKKIIQLVVIMLTTTLFLTSCNNSSDPEAVAKNYIKALNNNDFKKAAEYCDEKTAELLKTLEPLAKMAGKEGKSDYEFVKSVIKTDKATIYFKDKKKGEMKVDLIKVDGKWKVSMGKEDMGGAPPASTYETPNYETTPQPNEMPASVDPEEKTENNEPEEDN